ncbi:MAG: Spore coat protein F precursor [Pelotomaculum sp. PtaB.Bin104]|nr:MAG: Spore coat protein F precursor [Pelotomaculum sp. PtaB.Bin104]
MAASLGAHEVMELHEILTKTIDGINHFQLYRPHVKDQQLGTILDNQLRFMIQEYNNMVQAVSQQGRSESIPYRTIKNVSPTYGLKSPLPQAPNTSANELDDRDVASGMLGFHKASATLKMIGALEMADPSLRRMMQQSAINCSEQAYETWSYMNQKGYYQVPTMKDMTTQTMINGFTATNMGQMGQMGQMS